MDITHPGKRTTFGVLDTSHSGGSLKHVVMNATYPWEKPSRWRHKKTEPWGKPHKKGHLTNAVRTHLNLDKGSKIWVYEH